MDIDKNNQIEQSEFLTAWVDHSKYYADDDKLMQAFNWIDKDKNGQIDRFEISKMLGKSHEDLTDYVMKMIDADKDELISFEEFKSLMTQEVYDSKSNC